MSGHGHVTPKPDGSKARCGGPGLCSQCSREAARHALAFKGTSLTTDIRACARCDQDHPELTFTKMEHPVDPDYPFWAACPNGAGPILLKAIEAE